MTVRNDVNTNDIFLFDAISTTDIYTLSLHDALPISLLDKDIGNFIREIKRNLLSKTGRMKKLENRKWKLPESDVIRSEEHTSELQSRGHLVCRLLLEKKKRSRTQQTPLLAGPR